MGGACGAYRRQGQEVPTALPWLADPGASDPLGGRRLGGRGDHVDPSGSCRPRPTLDGRALPIDGFNRRSAVHRIAANKADVVVRLFWVDCRPSRTAAVLLHGSCNEAARKRLLATDSLRCLEVIETRVEKREMGGASVPTGCDSIGSADACSARSPAQMQTQHCSASALRQA